MDEAQILAALEAEKGQLLPACCGFAAAWASDELPESVLPGAAISRRKEYATGRACAQRALLAVGHTEVCELVPDVDGVPIWPEKMLGSITHSKGLCAAVAAPVNDVQLLGLDMERTDRLKPAAIKRVVHPLEHEFVEGGQVRASILFSLKEAFYKAQFLKWRTAGNFHDLALAVDLVAGTAAVQEIGECFDRDLREQAGQLEFRFALVGDFVCSLCWLGSRL